MSFWSVEDEYALREQQKLERENKVKSKFKEGDEVVICNLEDDIDTRCLGLTNGLKGVVVNRLVGGLRPVVVMLFRDNREYSFKEGELKLVVELPASNINKPIEFEGGMYNPLLAQEGGNHYKDRGIQPIEYSIANNLNACQHSVVKYITRHQDKNGVEDLGKIIHFTLLEAFFKYGIEGSTDLKKRVLKMLGEGKESKE